MHCTGRQLKYIVYTALAATLGTMGAMSCRRTPGDSDKGVALNDTEVLYRLGDSTLTVERVVAQIPRGLEPADSAALFNAIAEDWLFSMLLEREAQLNFGERETIEAQVRQYRRRLLAARYRETIAANADNTMLSEDSVKAIYTRQRNEYRLEAPMVKGVLLQIATDNPQLDNIRRWMQHPSAANLDRIEKASLNQALQYEYFADEWQDWRDIAALVPYRFPNADTYVATHPSMETEHEGSVYLLTITDHLPTASYMPYQKAAPLIRTQYMQRSEGESDRLLLQSLRSKALTAGILKEYRH